MVEKEPGILVEGRIQHFPSGSWFCNVSDPYYSHYIKQWKDEHLGEPPVTYVSNTMNNVRIIFKDHSGRETVSSTVKYIAEDQSWVYTSSGKLYRLMTNKTS